MNDRPIYTYPILVVKVTVCLSVCLSVAKALLIAEQILLSSITVKLPIGLGKVFNHSGGEFPHTSKINCSSKTCVGLKITVFK